MSPLTEPPTPSAVTSELAAFVREAEPPEHLIESARRALAATVAAGVMGADSAPATAVREAVGGLGTPGRATVLGRPERLSPALAALVNGTAAGCAAAGEGRESVARAIVPAALAAAEHADAGLEAVWRAVAVGLEACARIGRALGDGHEERGWATSATAGHVGAAAACAAVSALSHRQVMQALGLAATQAAGLSACAGSDVGAFQLGKAAANGVESTLLVSRDFTAPLTGIEGRRGLLALMGDLDEAPSVLDGLGLVWASEPLAEALPALDGDGAEALIAACLGTGGDRSLAEVLSLATGVAGASPGAGLDIDGRKERR